MPPIDWLVLDDAEEVGAAPDAEADAVADSDSDEEADEKADAEVDDAAWLDVVDPPQEVTATSAASAAAAAYLKNTRCCFTM
jgi:hypothetical protein